MGLECKEMVRIENPARVGNRKMEIEARYKGKRRGAEDILWGGRRGGEGGRKRVEVREEFQRRPGREVCAGRGWLVWKYGHG